ncbi:uncharacterized protein BDR25DRAFT_359185 [Lindgomyces ingoldianus]|uniref:Uncharacterized protein n=1 Tax=Lindgomyces ingoldianus TaxID=673940 RepID=A0ACB6QI38_9PLEO|nr:uncharacterized protein BDR25DRAFT_359185 [Lindgomyces ingoldianus]KAF2466669.1 hypothetical protein BDR25DRAFT_359185 [Lindgomyces ingoldianus]
MGAALRRKYYHIRPCKTRQEPLNRDMRDRGWLDASPNPFTRATNYLRVPLSSGMTSYLSSPQHYFQTLGVNENNMQMPCPRNPHSKTHFLKLYRHLFPERKTTKATDLSVPQGSFKLNLLWLVLNSCFRAFTLPWHGMLRGCSEDAQMMPISVPNRVFVRFRCSYSTKSIKLIQVVSSLHFKCKYPWTFTWFGSRALSKSNPSPAYPKMPYATREGCRACSLQHFQNAPSKTTIIPLHQADDHRVFGLMPMRHMESSTESH